MKASSPDGVPRSHRGSNRGSNRQAFGRERLAFGHNAPPVPRRGSVDATLREPISTLVSAGSAEPRDWGYGGLLAFTMVMLARPQDLFPVLAPLHLAEVCAVIGIAPMVIHRFTRRLPMFRVTPETIALLLLGVVILITIPFSTWPGGSLQFFFDYYVKAVIVVVLMMNTLTSPQRLERITWLIVVCVGYVATRGVFDYVRGANLIEGNRLVGGINGIWGNPNDLALNMVAFMPVVAVITISRHYPPVRRAVAGMIGALMMVTIVFTKSRGGIVGLIVMLLCLLLLGHKVRRGFGSMVLAAVLVATPLVPSSFWARMASIVDEKQDQEQFTGSREARRLVMQEGIDAFIEHPLTGVGIGQFENYNPGGRQERWRTSHNVLIEVASEIGIGGLVLFGFLILRAGMAAASTRRLLGRMREDLDVLVLDDEEREKLYAHTVAMTASLVGWLTCAMFASVAFNWTFYYILALILAANEMVRDRLSLVAPHRSEKPSDIGSRRRSRRSALRPA